MRTPDDIPLVVRQRQTDVSNPDVSAWVAANAGSGKTHVLAQRVINLLLKGVEPEKILCITFTKAAAANMAKRVFDTLGAWTKLSDEELDKAIKGSGIASDAKTRILARRLFARALETPGGLKVQTIHAFCTQLLQRFPFEANVAARFSVLDDVEQTQLLESLTLAVLLQGAEAPESRLGCALAVAMTSSADQTFREIIRRAIAQGDALQRWIVQCGGMDKAIAALSKTLGVDPAMTLAEVEHDIINGPILPPSEWPGVAALCRTSSAMDQKQDQRLTLASRLSGREQIKSYFEVFFDSKSEPRANLLTKGFANKQPGLAQRLRDEQTRVVPLRERRNAIICRDRSAALITVASEVLTRYQKEKRRRGVVDYDDLIGKTLDLLRNTDAAWVHYKLDLGIDHLLIDEAQDTSTKQWEIVQLLVAEFTAGAGARPSTRTIFAVGDEKQSIFSFQNAAPHLFGEMRRFFERRHNEAGLTFEYRQLEHSFRSCDSVLGAVDIVFKDIAGSVTSDSAGGIPPHIALPDAQPGTVEIWETIKPEKRDAIEGWDAPFDTVSEVSPRVKLARRIARTVRQLIDAREPVGIERRPVRYGDVMVLVRQRGSLFEAIIRALKNEGVEVAGADRLILTEHVAVMDLMALADALLLPHDDLALAAVLRSPLFGFSDQNLFDIAAERGRKTLRTALAGQPNEKFAKASAELETLAAMARRATPFAFFAHVLGAHGGRRQFLARLGLEANDALDEFLNLALDYERYEAPSLQGFLAWLRKARAEIKRDMEIKRDEVRVMTVHGAKGLEAPIVVLADTITPPAGPRPPRLLKLGDGLIWVGRKADDVAPVQTARQSALRDAEDEYRRLLYVAMTRAADRLIVCGAEGPRGRPPNCWYDLVREPLGPLLIEEIVGEDKVLRYRKTPYEAVASSAPAIVSEPSKQTALPDWLRQSAPAESPRITRLSPSGILDDEARGSPRTGTSAAERQKALQRGRLVHRLLQSLPDIPQERRQATAKKFLAKASRDFSDTERAEIAHQVLALLGDARFAEIFAPGGRAEVPIVGQIKAQEDGTIPVSGQVDRLVITEKTVLIADYKSDRIVPERLADIEPYVAQLAAYRAVLARLYPGKSVRAALIFTNGPKLVDVPPEAMDAALTKAFSKALAGPSRPGEGSLTLREAVHTFIAPGLPILPKKRRKTR
ncbi:MAG TPA: double-strand break repair helicase AddA [Xanthobacteraceae bacterium]|jgi:ATP-dependent helicase/nuclease subunit A|nr:double-strand break repair helicase AddA [Xanthobacteraceae bacterium]